MKWHNLTIKDPVLPQYDKIVLLCCHHENYNHFDKGYDDVYLGIRKYTDAGGEHYFYEATYEIKDKVTKWAEIEDANILDVDWPV